MPLPGDKSTLVEDTVAESDGESESDSARLPTSSSEKKRARYSRFHTWRKDTAEVDFKKQVKQNESRSTADEALSIRDLLAKQESTPIIADPREYQIELFERAKQQNTIAVLDTGSGKTLIAVLLLRHVLDQELIDRAMGNPPRISFFLVSHPCNVSAHLLTPCQGSFCNTGLPTIRRSGTQPRSQRRALLRCYELQPLDARGLGKAFRQKQGHSLHCRRSSAMSDAFIHQHSPD